MNNDISIQRMSSANEIRAKWNAKERNTPKLLTKIANFLQGDYHFITLRDNQTCYFYNEETNLWDDQAIQRIKEDSMSLIDDLTVNHQNEIINRIKCTTGFDREKLNPSHLIGFENDVLDLDSWSIIPHKYDQYLTRKIPVTYDSASYPIAWEKFFMEVIEQEDIPRIQEVIAYCICPGYPIHKIFVLNGEGANGKSTLLNGTTHFLGEKNVSHIPMQDFDKNRFAASKLFGKYANIVNDLPDKELHQTGKLKQLSGGDYIWGDIKNNKQGIEFINEAKMFFSANSLPKIDDNSMAIYRRLTVIDFHRKFTGENADPNLLDKLTTPEELSGLLNVCLWALSRLLRRGYFEGDQDHDKLKERYLTGSDSVHAFADYALVYKENGSISNDKLYKGYVKYCRKHNLTPKHKQTLSKQLPMWKENAESSKSGGTRYWKGIAFHKSTQDGTLETTLGPSSTLDEFSK